MNETEFCIICGKQCSLSNIESLGWDKFNDWAHSQLPKQLFRYFPNKVSVDGKNHSIEALANGTVYINDAERFDDCFDCAVDMEWGAFYEKRIKRYCSYLDIDYTIVPLEEIPYKIVLKLFEFGTPQNALSHVPDTLDAAQKLSLENLILNAFIAGKSADGWYSGILKQIKGEYINFLNCLKHFKIACFTVSPYLNRMWATNNSTGFCIEYETDNMSDLCHNLFPVIYSQQRNDYTELSLNCDKLPDISDLWQMYFNGLLRKSIHWVDQQEWRLISYEQDNKAKNIPFFKIKKVYLGNKMPCDERSKIIGICKEKGYPYVGIKRQPNSFNLTDCPYDCGTCAKLKSNVNQFL